MYKVAKQIIKLMSVLIPICIVVWALIACEAIQSKPLHVFSVIIFGIILPLIIAYSLCITAKQCDIEIQHLLRREKEMRRFTKEEYDTLFKKYNEMLIDERNAKNEHPEFRDEISSYIKKELL